VVLSAIGVRLHAQTPRQLSGNKELAEAVEFAMSEAGCDRDAGQLAPQASLYDPAGHQKR